MGLSPAGYGERVLWALLIAVVASFLAGSWLNRQRSKQLGAWLQAGLGVLGGRPAWRWIRSVSSGAEVAIANPKPPFRGIRISYYLLTREFLPLWGFERLKGKRDLLSVRADLRRAPAYEFEVVPLHGALRRTLDTEQDDRHWQEMPAGLGLATHGPPEPALAARITSFLEIYGPYVERLSLRSRHPHVILFVRLTGLEAQPCTDLVRAFTSLFSEASPH